MIYIQFTHSQCFETFVRCHIHAFQALGGIAPLGLRQPGHGRGGARRQSGSLSSPPARLCREFGFLPRACHVASPWENGKVERLGIGYMRQNFWPLRVFTGLADVSRQIGGGWTKSPISGSTARRANVRTNDSSSSRGSRYQRCCLITATPPMLSSTKICASSSTATVTVCRPTTSAAG
jgi:hypothetical protein